MATTVDEIAEGVYRIHTPAPGFSFNHLGPPLHALAEGATLKLGRREMR